MKFYIIEPIVVPRYIYIDIPAETEEEAIQIIQNCNDPEELIDKYMDYSEIDYWANGYGANSITVHSEQTEDLIKSYPL